MNYTLIATWAVGVLVGLFVTVLVVLMVIAHRAPKDDDEKPPRP